MMRRLAWMLAPAILCCPAAADDGRAARLQEARASLAEAERLADRRDPRAEERFRAALVSVEGLGPNLLLARALDGLAGAARDGGRLDEAQALYERVIPLWEALLGPEQPRLAVSLHNLGALQLARGRAAEAAPLFRRALDIWSRALGPDSPQALEARRALRVAIGDGHE